MSYADNRRQAAKEEAQEREGKFLKIDQVINLKGKKFSTWDKEKEERVEFDVEFNGFIVGSFMQMEVFNDEWGNDGGFARSSYYTALADKVKLFSNHMDDWSGTAADAKLELKQYGTVKVKRIYIVVLPDNRVVALHQNMAMAIDWEGRFFESDVRNDSEMYARVATFNVDVLDIEKHKPFKSTIKALGKFVTKNPPNILLIELNTIISDAQAEEHNLEAVSKMCESYRNYIKSDAPEISKKAEVDAELEMHQENNNQAADLNTEAEQPLELAAEEEDDLPF